MNNVRKNVLGLAVALLFVLPVIWLALSAVKPVREMATYPPTLLPTELTMSNFDKAFREGGFGGFILNSVIVSTLSTMIVIVLGMPAAYALSRTKIRAKSQILTTLLVISVFPIIAVIPALYTVLKSLGWLNTYQALIIPYVAFNLPLAIWTMRNAFIPISQEMEEAAEVDGASRVRTVLQVVTPQALPGIFVATVLTFVACWQEFLMALSFNSRADFQTAPVGIGLFGGAFELPYGTIFAASLVALVPIFILVIALRKWVVSGLSDGSVKG